MRRSAAVFLALTFATAGLAHAALAGSDGETPAKAPGHVEKTFLIPSSDGYGVGECLTTPDSAVPARSGMPKFSTERSTSAQSINSSLLQ